ncbi:MAG TPA: efflux RND transporter periplasmic adaptor subunit [Armatimonadota bacterium]|nr:efflux RND transporter periplasmic adaptor subunit [Armatimonadota bacterium]
MTRLRAIIFSLAAVVAVGAAGWGGWRVIGARNGASQHRALPAAKGDPLVVTTTARRQDLLITVTQTGVVAARNSSPVIPEISGRIQWICANGIVISAGEPLVRLDPTTFQDQVTDLSVRYDNAVRRQAEAEAARMTRMKEMRLRLQRAQDDVAAFERQQQVALQQAADAIAFHAKELEQRRQEVEVKRRLAAKGLVPGTEVEREEAALKAAEFSLQRERGDYELKKSQSAAEVGGRRRNVNNTARDMSRTRSWTERDVRMTGNEVENFELQLARAREDLAKTTLTAPAGGLVMLSPQGGRMGGSRTPRTGDWVSQGREVAAIISLGRMQVKLELDQEQIAGASMGQAAEVTIEALPGKALKGRVTAIGQNARRPPVQGWMGLSSSATFPVTIDLPPIGKALIRPGMRAGVRLVARRIKDAIVVPSGCIFRRDGRAVVFVQRNGKFAPVAVVTGGTNGDYTAIKQGLRAGERVALNDLGQSAAAAASAPAKIKEPQR